MWILVTRFSYTNSVFCTYSTPCFFPLAIYLGDIYISIFIQFPHYFSLHESATIYCTSSRVMSIFILSALLLWLSALRGRIFYICTVIKHIHRVIPQSKTIDSRGTYLGNYYCLEKLFLIKKLNMPWMASRQLMLSKISVVLDSLNTSAAVMWHGWHKGTRLLVPLWAQPDTHHKPEALGTSTHTGSKGLDDGCPRKFSTGSGSVVLASSHKRKVSGITSDPFLYSIASQESVCEASSGMCVQSTDICISPQHLSKFGVESWTLRPLKWFSASGLWIIFWNHWCFGQKTLEVREGWKGYGERVARS